MTFGWIVPATEVVVDASALLKLIIDESDSPAFTGWWEAHLRGGGRLMAPHIIRYEIGQRLTRDVLETDLGPGDRERLRDEALRGVVFADGAFIERWAPPLSFYDAAYVALAETTGTTLVTYDDEMIAVARQAGVDVLTP